MAEGGKDQQLPGLDLTHEQLFFISYAQVAATVLFPPSSCFPTHLWRARPGLPPGTKTQRAKPLGGKA